MTTTLSRPASPVREHATLIGQLADLLTRHHAAHLLPPLLTVIGPHLTGDNLPPTTPPVFVDVALLRQITRLLGVDRPVELHLAVITVIGPHLQQPTAEVTFEALEVALSTRELDVLRSMARGRPNGAIGRELYISEDTVKSQCRRIYRKLGAVDRTHAVALGYQRGVLPLNASAGAA